MVTGKTFQFLSMAKPTVIGRVSYPYPFIDRFNCLYVPQGDAEALAESIRWAYFNRSRLLDIGKNGYEMYRKHFSQKKLAEKLKAIIDNEILSA